MVPPKSWHSQTFHLISKSRQLAFAKSLEVSFINCIYFRVKSYMFWSRSRIRKQGSRRVSDFAIRLTPTHLTLLLVPNCEKVIVITQDENSFFLPFFHPSAAYYRYPLQNPILNVIMLGYGDY